MIQKLKSNGFINIVLKTFLSHQIPFPSDIKGEDGSRDRKISANGKFHIQKWKNVLGTFRYQTDKSGDNQIASNLRKKVGGSGSWQNILPEENNKLYIVLFPKNTFLIVSIGRIVLD